MVHYFAAVQSCGSLDGFNSESPERLHIDYTKEAYRASNKRDYVKQMMVWLGRQETVARFRAYLDYVITLDPNSHAIPLDDETQLELEDNKMEEPAHTYCLILPILSLLNLPSLTQTSTLSLLVFQGLVSKTGKKQETRLD